MRKYVDRFVVVSANRNMSTQHSHASANAQHTLWMHSGQIVSSLRWLFVSSGSSLIFVVVVVVVVVVCFSSCARFLRMITIDVQCYRVVTDSAS